jgi:hypothetical protein
MVVFSNGEANEGYLYGIKCFRVFWKTYPTMPIMHHKVEAQGLPIQD